MELSSNTQPIISREKLKLLLASGNEDFRKDLNKLIESFVHFSVDDFDLITDENEIEKFGFKPKLDVALLYNKEKKSVVNIRLNEKPEDIFE